MTVSTTTSKIVYNANGGTSYTFNFPIFKESDLEVIEVDTSGNETTWVLNTDYSVSSPPYTSGGSITVLKASPPSTGQIVIRRKLPRTQDVDYIANDSFPAETHEQALDRSVMLIQEVEEKVDRALLAGSASAGFTMPNPSANKIIGWDSAGSNLENKDVASLGAVTLPVSVANGGTGSTTASAARTSLAAAGRVSGAVTDDLAKLDANGDLADAGLKATDLAVGGNVLCPHENLRVTRPTASTIRVQADAVMLKDANGIAKRFTSVDVTVDITVSGAGGLDTGSEQASTWYRVYLIGQSGGTISGVFSTSQSAPQLPSGYTYYGKVAVDRNNASSDLWRLWQSGNRVTVGDEKPSGTAATLTPISATTVVFPTNLSMSSWIPDEAWISRWRVYGSASLGAVITTSNNGSGSVAGDFVYAAPGDNTVGEVMLNESRQVQYGIISGGSGNLTGNLLGWRYT